MHVLVVGATGALGTEICRRLRAAGHAVSGLVREGAVKEPALRALGVEIRRGDLRDGDSLEAACRGAGAVVSTATAVIAGGAGNSLAAVDGAGHARLVAAAKRQGVGRFLYVSASPKLSPACPLIREKRATEQALAASGLDWVVLQPSCFMDVWLSPALGWDLAAGKARIFGAGNAPVSWVAVADVASYAAAVLGRPAARNQAIPLGGPEALSPRQAVEVVEQVVGKQFQVTAIPGLVPRVASVLLRPLNPKLASLMALGAETLTGDPIDNRRALALAEVRLTPLAEWARAQVQVQAG
jgi:uncharacterized protein YbjT (DUF2867 family)